MIRRSWSLRSCLLLMAAVTGAGGCAGGGSDRATAPASQQPLPDVGWRRGICSPQGWCWGYPRPQGLRLNRLWGSGPGDLWAVGDAGTILRFNGATWTRVDSGSTDALVAISGSAFGDAWAVGRGRTLLQLRGTSWQRWVPATGGDHPRRLPEQATGEFRDIVAFPNGEAWVVGGSERGGLADDDSGGTCVAGRFDAGVWLFDEDIECNPLVEVWGRAPDDVWARGGGDVIHWNGRTLTKNPPEKPARVVGRHGFADGWRLQIDWASGTVGTLLHAAHVPRPEQAPRARDFWAFGATDVWAIGGEGELAHFDGRIWENGDVPLRVQDVAARARDDLWAVAAPATLLHFDGRAWNASPIPGAGTASPSAIAAPARNDVWVLAGTKILRFNGSKWSEPAGAAALGHRTPTALLALAPNDVWIGAERLALHWNGQALEPHETDFAVSTLWGAATEVWAGSPPHRWTGSAFVTPAELAGTAKPASTAPWVEAAGAAVPGTLWLAAGGRISRLAAGGLRTVGTLPVSLRAIWQSPSGDVWAVGSHIVHGVAGREGAMSWTIEDSVGLTDMTRVGGTRELVWVRGAEGVLVRAL